MKPNAAPGAPSTEPVLSGALAPEPVDPNTLLRQLGSEVARALSDALERLAALAATAPQDRDAWRPLRDDIEGARRAAIMAQQWVRLSTPGHVRLSQERLDLTNLLQDAVHLHQRELRSRGIRVHPTWVEVSVTSDAALTFSFVETLLDWACEHARTRMVLRLDARQRPARARLTCAFLRRAPDGPTSLLPQAGEDASLNTLAWHLLHQTADRLGLRLRRIDTADRCELRVTFPGAEVGHQALLDGLEAEDVTAQAYNSQPLAGRHVVVLAARRDLRSHVRDTLRPMGLMIDVVATIEEAQALFAGALPHAVIYEAALGGERFERLRNEMLAEVPSLAFIQITDQGKPFEVLESGGHPFASVGRASLSESLPAALLFELSRHG